MLRVSFSTCDLIYGICVFTFEAPLLYAALDLTLADGFLLLLLSGLLPGLLLLALFVCSCLFSAGCCRFCFWCCSRVAVCLTWPAMQAPPRFSACFAPSAVLLHLYFTRVHAIQCAFCYVTTSSAKVQRTAIESLGCDECRWHSRWGET